MGERNPAAEGIEAARNDVRRARELAAAVEEAAQLEHESAEAAHADAGFDAGEFSGPAHADMLETALDELAERHGFTREELDTALKNAAHDDDGSWHNPDGPELCGRCGSIKPEQESCGCFDNHSQ